MSWLAIILCLCFVLVQRVGGDEEEENSSAVLDPSHDPNPVSMPFDDLLGKWYIQVFIPPCSWHGAKEAKSFVQWVSRTSGYYKVYDKWRFEECVQVVARLYPTRTPGVYLLKDNIGNVISGEYVFVAMERDCFHVVWGCVKRCPISRKCQDYWLAAKTRDENPDLETKKKIDTIFHALGMHSYGYVDHSLPC